MPALCNLPIIFSFEDIKSRESLLHPSDKKLFICGFEYGLHV